MPDSQAKKVPSSTLLANCELQKKFAHAHVRAHMHVCDVRAKLGLKRVCDVRACEAFRGLVSCDRNFTTLLSLLSLKLIKVRTH